MDLSPGWIRRIIQNHAGNGKARRETKEPVLATINNFCGKQGKSVVELTQAVKDRGVLVNLIRESNELRSDISMKSKEDGVNKSK